MQNNVSEMHPIRLRTVLFFYFLYNIAFINILNDILFYIFSLHFRFQSMCPYFFLQILVIFKVSCQLNVQLKFFL